MKELIIIVISSFPKRIGNGGWSADGVATTVQVTQEGNNTMVQCNSTHLSSFAVLSMDVDVAGTPVRICILHTPYTHLNLLCTTILI